MTAAGLVDITALTARCTTAAPRYDWTRAEIDALFALPFSDLLFLAQQVHRRHFAANQVQMSTLLSIKTGGCPEDCAYCPQCAQFDTGVKAAAKVVARKIAVTARRARITRPASRRPS